MGSTSPSSGRNDPDIAASRWAEATVQPSATGRVVRGRRRLAIPWRGQMTGHHRAILVVVALALAFYMWTAYTASPFSFSSQNSDIYNELSTAFLHGHTSLPLSAPPGLLHLKDPYDPAQNAPYQASFHDLAFKNGHFYSPWGPTPALTLFIPFRITGLSMSQSFAAALYAFIGLACAVVVLQILVSRLLPQTPKWLVVVMSAALALTNVVPFMLRRPAQYEVAISAGYCFEMAGILLALTAVLKPSRAPVRLALASLCFGLAIGARLSLAPAVLVAVGVALYVSRDTGNRRRLLGAALVPFVACVLLLGLYNVARFGSFSDFGEQYQLAGLNQMTMPADRVAYVPPGMFTYLLMPPRLALAFPHVFLMNTGHYPGPFPKDYSGAPGGWPAEPTGGLLPTMPITLLLLGLPFLWRRRRSGERPALLVAAAGTALAVAIMGLLTYALWGTTQRYEVDYASIALIAAFLVWALLLGRQRARTAARRWIAVGGIALCLIGAMVGTAVSFTGYYDSLRLTNPGVFNTLEDLTSPFATLPTMVAQKAVIARIDGPIPITPPPQSFTRFTETGASIWLGGGPVTVAILSPSAQQRAIIAVAQPAPGAPPPSTLAIGVQSPGHKRIVVPLTGRVIWLPVSLHWGLNRISVTLLGYRGAPAPVVSLGNIGLGR